jgi:hypothetical protein
VPVLVTAGRGEYTPAAELLTATRVAAEWENRDQYTTRLAAFARSRGEWLDRWRRAPPHAPEALLIPLRSRSAAAPCPRSEHTDPARPDDH